MTTDVYPIKTNVPKNITAPKIFGENKDNPDAL
jgi:hypothetical protein